MEKKKFLLVLTGGTISTVERSGVLGIHGDSPHILLERYRACAQVRKDVWFDVFEPVRMLSECSRPEILESIYYAVLGKLGIAADLTALKERGQQPPQREELPYDGIIMTHGSDTLSYSAAFFAEVFSWLAIPMALTASDRPLSDAQSNGMVNFISTVEFLCQPPQICIPQVYVIWRNTDSSALTSSANIYLARHLLEADTFHGHFSSYTGELYGQMHGGICSLSGESSVPSICACDEGCPPSVAQISKGRRVDVQIPLLHIQHSVLLVRPYPGLRYDLIALENSGICAVVHYLYHSATACTQGGQYDIVIFAKRCKKLGIDLYLAGFQSLEQRLYETNSQLLSEGLGEPLYSMSPEYAYMKVLVAYNKEE